MALLATGAVSGNATRGLCRLHHGRRTRSRGKEFLAASMERGGDWAGSGCASTDLSSCKKAFCEIAPAVRGHRFILFLGRIDRKKGCDLLLRAFVEVCATEDTVHLVMAGPDSGNWRAELEATAGFAGISERVHWPGMLKGNAKWGALAACEAFILPSHQENFGIAVVEALVCAKPVLLTRPINIADERVKIRQPLPLRGRVGWLGSKPEGRAPGRGRRRFVA